ncbi:SDR family NAD(P)-dependent oxidoreductase, partial [Pseudomonas aeruginosa]
MHTHSPIPRTALVTGGSSGIGLAIARRLRQQGYRIALVARDSQRLQRAAAELGGVPWMAADLSRREAVEAVAAWVGDTFQGLDVLVNNAGFTRKIAATTPLAEAEREWDALLDGNLKSAFLMSLAVLPHFAEEGGRIIHIGSIAAQTGSGSPGALGYAAAKAGLHGFGVALARELGSRGITVNSVAPGYIADT